MSGSSQALLHGEFGAGAARYALTLTCKELHVQRLSPRPEQEKRLVLPLSHVIGCRLVRPGVAGRRRREPVGTEEGEVDGDGENGEAHFALYCYLPKKGLVGGTKGRQRLVKSFRADGEGARSRAQRWVTAVRCRLLGVEVPGEAEISLELLPRSRRLLLLVNPFSGRSLAMNYCQEHVLPMIAEANISYNLICTDHQNHAWQLVQEIKLSEWDGIVVVSGDGLLHEVINGLMSRADWKAAMKMPLGIIPAGSGNALAAAVNHNAGFRMSTGVELLVNCVLLLCRGSGRGLATPLDLVSVTTATGRRLFSFLSVAWGFVADVDVESERLRRAGPARFTLGTLGRLATLRRYPGRLSYLPAVPRLRRSGTLSPGPPPSRPPLGRTLSDSGPWGRGHDHSPPPFSAYEGFSFEGASFAEEEEDDEVGAEGGEARAVLLNSDRENHTSKDPAVVSSNGGSTPEGLSSENSNISASKDPRLGCGGPSVSHDLGNANICAQNDPGPVNSEEFPAQEQPGLMVERDSAREGHVQVSTNNLARKAPGSHSPEGNSRVSQDPGLVTSEMGIPASGSVGRLSDGDISGPQGPGGGVRIQRPPFALPLPRDDLLPPPGAPLPQDWVTVEGDFVLVLAIYQSHLGAELMTVPSAQFAQGVIHLCYVMAGISRASLLRLFLAMEKGAHFDLRCPHLTYVPATAFRIEPLGGRPGIVTVDGERVEYGTVQGQIHPGLARLVTGFPPSPPASGP